MWTTMYSSKLKKKNVKIKLYRGLTLWKKQGLGSRTWEKNQEPELLEKKPAPQPWKNYNWTDTFMLIIYLITYLIYFFKVLKLHDLFKVLIMHDVRMNLDVWVIYTFLKGWPTCAIQDPKDNCNRGNVFFFIFFLCLAFKSKLFQFKPLNVRFKKHISILCTYIVHIINI